MRNDDLWREFALTCDRVVPRLFCYQRVLAKIMRDVQDRALILDAGCGTGIMGEALVIQGHTVIGIDNNSPMLSQAFARRARLTPEQIQAWTLMPGDVAHLPAEVPEQLDAIIFGNVIQFVDDYDAVFRSSLNRLRPQGVLIVTGPRHRPDMQKVFAASVAEWIAAGNYDQELQKAAAEFGAVSRRLISDPAEMVTFFEPPELVRILSDIGFPKILAADDDDYYGENFYVVAVAK